MFSVMSAVTDNLYNHPYVGQGIQATSNYYKVYFWINDYTKRYVQYQYIVWFFFSVMSEDILHTSEEQCLEN